MNAWKWTRRLASIGDMLERQIHEHRLAAPDAAPQIDAGGPVAASLEEPRKKIRFLHARRQPVERRHRPRLRRVGLQLACLHQLRISAADRSDHAGALRSRMRFNVPLKL